MSGPFGSTAWMANPASGFYDFEISNSLRFDTASNTYLDRDSYTHDRQTFTYSFWFKPTTPGTRQFIFGRYIDGDNVSALEYDDNGRLSWYDYQSGAYTFQQRTSALFRDVSAWYHVVLRVDTTDSTAGSRARMYINGTQQTSFGASTTVDRNVSFLLGDGGDNFRWGTEGSNNRLWYGGYLADIIVIDGSSLPPTSFAETKNDIWIPKSDIPGSDSYGARGYRLQFKNNVFDNGGSSIGVNTGSNSTDLGSPAFTASGLAAGDSVPDSPTNNFATYNSIAPDTTGAQNHGFSEGNLKVTNLISSGAKWWNCFGTIGMSSGKYYWEHSPIGSGTVDLNIGVCTLDWYRGSNGGADTADAYTLYANSSGKGFLYTDDESSPEDKGTGYYWTWGDVMGVAFDADTGKIWYAKNGTFLGSGDPAAGSNAAHTVTSGDLAKGMLPVFSGEPGGQSAMVNFGQDSSFAGNETAQGNADANGIGDFYYTPPSGFLALCTANLPDPVATIDPNKGGSPQNYFSADIFTGNGTNQDIDIGFVPNLVWTKQRTDDSGGLWMDSVRGDDAYFQTPNGNAEGNFGNITFTSTGYNVNGNSNVDNENAHNYAGWAWKAETAFSNDASSTSVGSLDSSGTVNTDVGFSIIKWTAVGSSATQTIAHGLGAVPKLIIMKNRERTVDWAVYHEGLGNTHGMSLNTNAASSDDSGWWNDTTPTSTVFTTGNGNGYRTGGVAEDYIAYCFAEVDGYSKFALYTGNGDADGTFVYTGFRPSFVIYVKTAGENWHMKDTKTAPFNVMRQVNDPNRVGAEVADANTDLDFLSNGFKMRANHATQNEAGSTYIYIAFAEQPFKYANGR